MLVKFTRPLHSDQMEKVHELGKLDEYYDELLLALGHLKSELGSNPSQFSLMSLPATTVAGLYEVLLLSLPSSSF